MRQAGLQQLSILSFTCIRPDFFHFNKVQLHTAMINKDGDPNTISKDLLTAATGQESGRRSPKPKPAQESSSSQRMGNTRSQENDRDLVCVTSNASLQTEYAAKKIVVHKYHGQGWRYIVGWYGYRPANDTLKSAKNFV